MTKKKSSGGSDDRTTSRGTVKGQHDDPDAPRVPEGGKAPSPTGGHGSPKGSASKATAEGAAAGDDTSTATVGKREKEQAEAANAGKRQSGHPEHGS